MNSAIYRQYDTRWGGKPYPTKSSNFENNGCGACSITHLLIEYDKYKSYTPEKVRKYIVDHKGCVCNQGTYWSAIGNTLEHYGFCVNELSTMDQVWEHMKSINKDHLGIILFSGGSRNGITWTGGGHYMAFTDYKIKNGKHYFYMKDSGPRKHDGWYCYETYMKGLVFKIWSAYAPKLERYEKDTKKTYDGSYPSTTLCSTSKTMTKTNIKYWQKFLNWWGKYNLEVDGIYGTQTKSATKKFQKAYCLSETGWCNKTTLKKAKAVGKSEKR